MVVHDLDKSTRTMYNVSVVLRSSWDLATTEYASFCGQAIRSQ